MCRTEKLGIAELVCTSCGDIKQVLRSCKHRFCSRCGSISTKQWGEGLSSRLLDVKHHHIVMTLPKAYRQLSKQNGTKIYDILFKTSRKVIQKWFRGRFGLRIGVMSVLHTAGSDLKYHPHIHMVVSRGGQHKQSGKYKEISGNYLCTQHELGRRFRYAFEQEFLKLYKKGELKIYKKLKDEFDLKKWMRSQKAKHWIVSIQKPLSNVKDIVGYIGRYTKRACMSEYKLESIEDGIIRFRYNDYKNSERGKPAKEAIKEQSSEEFLDSLLQHVPKKGYRMVRYGGLYNSYYSSGIPEEWKQKETLDDEEKGVSLAWQESEEEEIENRLICSYCGIERVLLRVIYSKQIKEYEVTYTDTS